MVTVQSDDGDGMLIAIRESVYRDIQSIYSTMRLSGIIDLHNDTVSVFVVIPQSTAFWLVIDCSVSGVVLCEKVPAVKEGGTRPLLVLFVGSRIDGHDECDRSDD